MFTRPPLGATCPVASLPHEFCQLFQTSAVRMLCLNDLLEPGLRPLTAFEFHRGVFFDQLAVFFKIVAVFAYGHTDVSDFV